MITIPPCLRNSSFAQTIECATNYQEIKMNRELGHGIQICPDQQVDVLESSSISEDTRS